MNKNSYLVALAESDATDFGKVDFSEQAEEQRIFSAIWSLESEVNNGGFLQYFGSWNGDTANYAPVALRKIGAHNCAEIVERAAKLVSLQPLPGHDVRSELLASLDPATREKIHALDTEFYAYPDNLTELLYEYVRSCPQVFEEQI